MSRTTNNAWRTIDFSSIRETYIAKPEPSSGPSGYTILYVLMSLPGLVMLPIFLFIFFGARAGGGAEKLFRGFHYFLIGISLLPLLALFGFASSTPTTPFIESPVGIAVSGLISAVYFLLMKEIGQKSINQFQLEATKRKKANKAPIWLTRNKVYGTPGNLSTARGKFTDENIAKGEDGERRTADLMDDLLKIPGTRIFHGVSWPGAKDADIDHIAVNGNKIALIDSKLWSGQSHVFQKGGHVISYPIKDEIYPRKISLPMAMRDFKESLRYNRIHDVSVMGWVAIHSHGKRKPKVDNAKNPYSYVKIAPAVDSIDEIGHWFAKGVTGIVDVSLMDNIAKRLK